MKNQFRNFVDARLVRLCIMLILVAQGLFAQQIQQQDSVKTGFSFGEMKLPDPSGITSKYEYDPITDRYIFTQKVGDFNINYPVILTPKEYDALVTKESVKSYYKEKIDAFDGKKEGTEDAQKNLLPEYYVKSGLFETIFGGNTIEIIPQGSVEMDLGILYTRQDNPAFSPRNRSNFTFDFNQRISLSMLGKVGTRLQVNANYDTQSTFDFQNLIKLEYTPDEDDIVKKIEVGNVSMPLNSSLITGSQSLFGVKTELQFGKTKVTAVFSEQKSQSKSVVSEGGGTVEEYEIFARDYDENRHYFLSQYFYQNYDKALERYPFINNNIQITRIEVWVTNRSNRTENVRNVVAFQDLGESDVIGLDSAPPGFVNIGPGAYPDNGNNDFDPTNIGGSGSQLTEAVRDISTVESGILPSSNEGFDYGKLENAKKLIEGSDYKLNNQLGYISLNQRLLNDEVLAVAFQYTVGGEVFQVGEFANDGVEATGIDNTVGENEVITNKSLVLKMLKSAVTSVTEPTWDLMMKNVYDTGAFQLSKEDFKLNLFYNEASPLNYITPVDGTTFPDFDNGTADPNDDTKIQETPLIRLFNFDRLNYNNDPQTGGDGFFDFVSGMTVLVENGKIVFTKAQPFGKYLFDILDDPNNPGDYDADTYVNKNQEKYVYDILYKSTKTAALEENEKNKFLIKGRYKSSGGDGIPLGAFNVPRGSVKVTAGGRVLIEGVDYTVNYQMGRVQILDEALKASNTPIEVSVENNAVFGQQTRRFAGVNVEHQFNENFLLGATFLNLNERPITQKANYGTEPTNNSIFGFNGNYSTEVPFFTRLVNKLPNIDTDAKSNLSVRGEFAYLAPGAPKGTDFNGEATAYVDDFEGTQGSIDLLSPQSWFLSSRPLGLGIKPDEDNAGYQNGFNRAHLNWYSIDPIFYSSRRPSSITDDDVSNLYTRRIFINEIFPEIDIVQGQAAVINSLDLNYYPNERGPYNFDTNAQDGVLDTPSQSWAGITRQITSTDFEQANVEYIDFWLQDPFMDNPSNPGGKLYFNLGNISEDVLKDGKKQYENGLPENGDASVLNKTSYETVVPSTQSLVYTFATTGQERTNQDVGYDGYNDADEQKMLDERETGLDFGPDPSNDNYLYFLNTEGSIFERYKYYNGSDGNSLEAFTDTNRGSSAQPDAEDINRDNTMNTIDSYFEYELDITPTSLANTNNKYINDVKVRTVSLPNGDVRDVTWYQFRIPISEPSKTVGGISDIRSIRFIRMYLNNFSEQTVLRLATLDLVRSDWRRYNQSLKNPPVTDPNFGDTEFNVGVIGLQQNDGNYVSPPGVQQERLNNNNNMIRQNEQSLLVEVCDLEAEDSRGVFKNISVDMRQYKNLKMFMHVESRNNEPLDDGEIIGFIRMGNDNNQNFYQIELPLRVTDGVSSNPDIVWPNSMELELEVLQKIKAMGMADGTLTDEVPRFYDVTTSGIVEVNEFAPREFDQLRVTVKGNPNFGDIRSLMMGVKNASNFEKCANVWFNELRLSELENEGGWAAIASLDTNFADFANISMTGKRSTIGFGSVEQRPNERSREDVTQYDVVTNVNLGQLLPKKWGVNIPFNFGTGEEIITPEFDQQFKDIKLQNRLDAATSNEEEEAILKQSQDYTKRKSINFIGVRKQKAAESKPRIYDVENLTFNFSHNKIEHRDFEIENSLDQNIKTGVNYNYSFAPKPIEPFKKNDSLFTGKYWKIFKDFNFNLLPNNISFNSNINRQFNKQKFRDTELTGQNIQVEELFRRNYTFDTQYSFNYNFSKSLSLNYAASNSSIVRNYFMNDEINGRQNPELDVWDGFFDIGDPNIQSQQVQLNYQLPLDKIPTLSFIKATYSYTGDFQWQKGSDLNNNLEIEDSNGVIQTYDLGHSIQNANTHTINGTLNLTKLYSYLGVKSSSSGSRPDMRRNSRPTSSTVPSQVPKKKSKSFGKYVLDGTVKVLTSVKRVQLNYSDNNGSFLPGYLRTPGALGTSKPTFGYTIGSQADIRQRVASNGWLTVFPEFNQQYTEVTNKTLDGSASIDLIRDLKIDLTGSRTFSENLSENFNATDSNGDGFSDVYNSLITNSFGNFNISTALIKTAFSKSNDNQSQAFDEFKSNRLVIAHRVAKRFYGDKSYEIDDEGYPKGYGKTSQAVLLPAFLSAYSGSDANDVSLSAFRDIPIPNWTLKYTGFMKMKWFKKHFRRFSINHGYRSSYTINQFRTNLDYIAADPNLDYDDQAAEVTDQSGNYKNEVLYSNINLEEQFSPLFRIDFELKNSIKILAEMKKDRVLSMSFDNNLLTEIQGKEYILGMGYRIKDLRIRSKLAGNKQIIKSDLNLKADLSYRDNKTYIRYLDVDNTQITSGQSLWSMKFNADYAFSKNLTGIFYLDYAFSDYAISTSFPQTTIRSGLTLRYNFGN